MLVAAMTASVFATPAAFGQLVNIDDMTQTAGIDGSHTNTQVKSAIITLNADNEAEIGAGKYSKVKDNTLTAVSV